MIKIFSPVMKLFFMSLFLSTCFFKISAKTLIVPTNYSTIQSAINAASRSDTVYVLNGIYYNTGLQYKSFITIIGQDNQNTIINGNGIGTAFIGSDAEGVSIENFKIINCYSAVYYYYNAGSFQGNISIVVRNNVMENISYNCISFYWNSFSNKAVIENNVFRNCGTAISMGRADNSVLISKNLIYGCNKGIDLNTYSYPLVINNVIAYSKAIGISVSGGKAKIINNTIVYCGNTGIYVTHEAMPLRNNIVCFNEVGISDYYSGTIGDYNNVYGNTINYSIPKGEHDISYDPLFVDTLVFHLNSVSPCIDAGDPFSDYDMEPDYNGGRINLGAYGNTSWATTSSPKIHVINDIYFDTLNIGERDSVEAWIHNRGLTRLNIESISTLSHEFSIINSSPNYIMPDDSLNIFVIFKPNIPGSLNSELIISTNDKDEKNTSIRLHGTVNYLSIPVILNIEDVPNDQGGWVKVHFTKSEYDTDSLILGKITLPEFYSIEIDDGSGWTSVAAQLAYGNSNYSSLVHTTKDSAKDDAGWIKFRVIAGMEEGNFVSDIAMGYSVDNLPPSIPSGLKANLFDNFKIELEWQSNFERDLKYYTVYRSIDGTNYGKLIDLINTEYIDENIELDKNYFYRLTATDYSGNESISSEEVKITVTEIKDNMNILINFNLSQNFPNPFNPFTIISFSIPEFIFVELKLYDILGNEIETLINEEKSAGNYEIKFNASGLSSGIYFYRLKAGEFTDIKSMLLLK